MGREQAFVSDAHHDIVRNRLIVRIHEADGLREEFALHVWL